jgi:hypothetical protein
MNIESKANEVQTTVSVNVRRAVGKPFYDLSCEKCQMFLINNDRIFSALIRRPIRTKSQAGLLYGCTDH